MESSPKSLVLNPTEALPLVEVHLVFTVEMVDDGGGTKEAVFQNERVVGAYRDRQRALSVVSVINTDMSTNLMAHTKVIPVDQPPLLGNGEEGDEI